MRQGDAKVLGASNMLVSVLRALNVAAAALVIASLAASFAFEPLFIDFFRKRPAQSDPAMLMPILRIWMLLAIPLFAALHVLLSRLGAILATVRCGDPFVPENAKRQKTIAWCLLVIQLLNLIFGLMAAGVNAAGSNVQWTFSITGWIAVVMLFVLARVFEQGTGLRDQLEEIV